MSIEYKRKRHDVIRMKCVEACNIPSGSVLDKTMFLLKFFFAYE